MKKEAKELVAYAWQIIWRLLVWLGSPFVILELLTRLHIIRINIPDFYLWAILCIGIIWVSFKLYRDQSKLMPPEKRPEKVDTTPKISVALAEGTQFTYSLEELHPWYDAFELPNGTVQLHVKVLNIGSSDVDILAIKGEFYQHELWFVNYQSAVLDKDNNIVEFPFKLQVQGKWLCHLTFPVKPNSSLNDAQIRDRLSKAQKDLRFRVLLEYRDVQGTTRTKPFEEDISTGSLSEKFVERLHLYDKIKSGKT